MSYLTSEIPALDLRVAFAGVVRRWWVIVIVAGVVLGFVVAQDFNFGRSNDTGIFVSERTYEGLIETDELGLASIEPSTIVPVPSLDNQLAILTSPETLEELRFATNTDSIVEVSRSEPKFTIIETIDDLNNRVSFLSTGTPRYSYKCFDNSADDCAKILDAFVSRTIALRKESVFGGLKTAADLIINLVERAQERLNTTSLTIGERQAREAELASLVTKKDALDVALAGVTGEMLLIAESSGPAVVKQKKISGSTYGFGMGLGLILGFLLALQLSVFDNRIRYRWQLARIDDRVAILGSFHPRSDDVQARALAAAIMASQSSGVRTIVVLALHQSLQSFGHKILDLASGMNGQVLESLEKTTVHDLVSDGTRGAVILIKAGITTRDEVSESITLLTTGGIRLIGVSLVD